MQQIEPSRRELEKRARRRAILDAARSEIAAHGFAGATLEDIATRAEFGKGTLYNYFPGGKDAILFAIFDELYDGLVQLVDDSFPEDAAIEWMGEARVLFTDLITRFFAYFADRAELFTILTREAHRMCFADEAPRVDYFLQQRGRIASALSRPIQAAADAGAIRQLPADAVAQMLFGNISGLQMHMTLDQTKCDTTPGNSWSPETAARFLTTFLFDGLLTEEAGTDTYADA